MAAAVQTPQMEKAINGFKEIQKNLQSNYESRAQLLTQQQENEIVQKELRKLEEDGVVYKLVGPVLVKQNLGDAKTNVDKRLDYINEEILRADKMCEDGEKELETKKEDITKLQGETAAAAQKK